MRTRQYFTLGGVPSTDFSIITDGSGIFQGAEADVETVSIPGRNGDLTLSNNRYFNATVQYRCVILDNFISNYESFRAFLLSDPGYRRLEDTYNSDIYRMARVNGSIDISQISWLEDAGTFTVRFNCMPQRFLKTGEVVTTYSTGDSVTNDTYFPAKPLIETKGYGLVTFTHEDGDVWEYSIASNDGSAWFLVDCETENCETDSGVNRNTYLTLNQSEFPKLLPGETTITFDNTFTAFRMTPRWFTL